MSTNESSADAPLDFIREIVRDDLARGAHARIVTRWPPEPNGYLHIGHAKAIALNFGIAEEFGGRCHLRFDDTNPAAESAEFVAAQQADLRWLGYEWGEHLYFASDYFEQLYEYARELIRRGRAFVCDLTPEEIFARRGTLTTAGSESPFRTRSAEENLELFARMRAGEFAPGARVLRAKIDMGSPVLTMRDPSLYRIVGARHHRRGDEWPIYPLYDFAHCLSDAIEGVTHSLCTMEFIDHRPLYDWLLEALAIPAPRPRQIEFNPLRLSHTVLSKRWCRWLIEHGHVRGWDDPRMPTLAGLRRRGVPPAAIRALCESAGVTRREEATLELARLEFEVRAELNRTAERRLGVLRPLKLVIENYPEGEVEWMELDNNPEDAAAGKRRAPFSRELFVERDDFMEAPPKKFHRLAPGREVRLRGAYLVTCTEARKNAAGEVVELRARYDPASRGGSAPDGRRVRGTLHWVSAPHAVVAQVQLFDRLFAHADPLAHAAAAAAEADDNRRVATANAAGERDADDNRDAADVGAHTGADLAAALNPRSLQIIRDARVEPALADAPPGARFQLERIGYFCVDAGSAPGRLLLNRTVTLRDTWAKIAAAGGGKKR